MNRRVALAFGIACAVAAAGAGHSEQPHEEQSGGVLRARSRASVAAGAGANVVSVQLLAMNDFHGNLEPPSGTIGEIGGTPAGGAEYLATYLEEAIASNPNSIVVAAGDVVGASPLVSALFHDEPTIESMNAMKLAVSSVGNHEFDKGWRALVRLQQHARFQYLSANVLRAAGARSSTLFPATAVRTIGGVKVGFIGETLKGTPDIVTSSGVKGLTFLDEASVANEHAERLKRQGVHAIVLLIHEGGVQTGRRDPNGCQDLRGPIVPIINKLSPDIKVVISGHTHEFYNCTIGPHTLTSASSFGRMITRITLSIDPGTDAIVSVEAKNEIVTRTVAKDAVQTNIVAKYAARAAPLANRVVGSVTADITRPQNEALESAIGDLIADAQLAATSAPKDGGAVVALMNMGGIRGEIIANHQAGNEQPAEVTYGELFSVQPFSNVLTVMTLTGDELRRLLEQQFDNPTVGTNRVLQVSNGFSYKYKLKAPAGEHVDPQSITISGRPVAPMDQLRLTTNSFLAEGGDDFSIFKAGRDRVGGALDVDALEAYFRTHSPVSPARRNRIIRVD